MVQLRGKWMERGSGGHLAHPELSATRVKTSSSLEQPWEAITCSASAREAATAKVLWLS